jgi:hypothetical protein
MKRIDRSVALYCFAIEEIIKLSEEEAELIVDSDYYDENGITIVYESLEDKHVQEFLLNYFLTVKSKGVSNEYLSDFLRNLFQTKVEVIGDEDNLLECLCCGYKTIEERGGYDICPVCFWEDDGSNDPERYSPPNHLTLGEAKLNFLKLGAISESFLDSVDKDGTKKYYYNQKI